jgi:hypothetical protein
MDADIKYILDDIQEAIDTKRLFGEGANEETQRAKRGLEKIKARLSTPAPDDVAEAIDIARSFQKFKRGDNNVSRANLTGIDAAIETLIRAAQAKEETPAVVSVDEIYDSAAKEWATGDATKNLAKSILGYLSKNYPHGVKIIPAKPAAKREG